MTTDRELLELAAKAAGIALVGPVEKFIVQFADRDKGGFIVRNELGGDSAWNPLTDAGDALRLAVKLKIEIGFTTEDYGRALAQWGKFSYTTEYMGQDPYAATRRAIVRAAAMIGEKL